MKKVLAVVLCAGLVGGALIGPAHAGKKKKARPPAPVRTERTVEHEYAFGSPGVPGVASACFASLVEESGCVNIELQPSEAYVSVKLADASGGMPYTILAQDTDDDGIGNIFANFCGATSGPLPITPGLTLRISTYTGASAECGAGATSGKITAVLSSMP